MGAALRIVMVTACLGLAACSSDKDPKLLFFTEEPGPDEFLVLPTKPLEAPEDFSALPRPTPGGRNLSDPTPEADAVAALGGSRDRVLSGGGVRDQALIARAARFGVADGIREELAAEDLEFRRKNDGRLLERLFNTNVYFRAYKRQSLDQYAELERFRALLLGMSYDDPVARPLLDLEGLKVWEDGRTTGFAQLNRAVDAFGTIDAFVEQVSG